MNHLYLRKFALMESFIISIVIFTAVLLIAYRRNSLRLLNPDSALGSPSLLILLNVTGILVFGLLPLLYFPLPQLFPAETGILKWPSLAGLVLLTSGFAYFIADKDLRQNKVEVHPTLQGSGFLSLYFTVRIAFIATYEIWFRGFFLFFCMEQFGTFNAVAINVVLYVLLHAVNGKREMLSCIPFGILLCAMAIWFESPLAAVLIHLALTVPYDIQFVRIKSRMR